MTEPLPDTGRMLTSTLTPDRMLTLAIADARVAPPASDEVVLRIEASPINPSDMMTMLAGADPQSAQFSSDGNVIAHITPDEARRRAGRFGQPLGIGLEGAGTVIAAGADAQGMIGRRVAALTLGRGTFGEYLTLKAADCVPLPSHLSARDGAALFTNPLTALAIAETVRLEGQSALIHTAAASNLGRMLVQICRDDGIALINLVRRDEQAALLRDLGAEYIVNSSAPTFRADLRAAITATGATIAFDALGGGTMCGELLEAMEDVAAARMPFYSPYGSAEMKQVYIYGRLDPAELALEPGHYGMVWTVRHWFMGATLERLAPERFLALRQRVLDEATTTFASPFTRTISLDQLLDRESMLAYTRAATGVKFLIDPTLEEAAP
jgi:NADPH:quinone reductase-like Zn-dependent oxidoreductase